MVADQTTSEILHLLWARLLARIHSTSRRTLALILAGAVCILAVAFYTQLGQGKASLHLKVQHGFRSAELNVWVDNDLACTAHMNGAVTKKFGFLPMSVRGSFAKMLRVPAGRHQVRVSIEAEGGAFVQTGTTTTDFVAQREQTLLVNSGRGSDLHLAWENSPAPVTGGSTGWLRRYANQMLMAVSGSLVSALTAYLIKEIPLFKSSPRADTSEKA